MFSTFSSKFNFGRFVPAAASGGSIDTGTAVAWTSATYFDSFTSQNGITTSNLSPTNNMCWQIYYAHRAMTIAAAANSIGLNTYLNGTNSWTWYASVSTVNDNSGSFPSESSIASTVGSVGYTAGGFSQQTVSSLVTIPANRYFLIGINGGPYYKTFRTLAANRTAQISGVSYVTAFNRVFYGPHGSGPTSGIPSQLGGARTGYTEYNGYVPVWSVKFTAT